MPIAKLVFPSNSLPLTPNVMFNAQNLISEVRIYPLPTSQINEILVPIAKNITEYTNAFY
jgi:hypothetical protein